MVHCIANNKTLTSRLRLINGPTLSRANLPIMSCVRITAGDDMIHLSTGCADAQMHQSFEADVMAKFSACVNMSRIMAVTGTLGDSSVNMSLADGKLVIGGANTSAKIKTMPDAEWPSQFVADMKTLCSVPAKALSKALQMSSAMTKDDDGYGVLLKLHDENLFVGGGDGPRIHASEIAPSQCVTNPDTKTEARISKGHAAMISESMDTSSDAKVDVSDRFLAISTASGRCIVSQLEGQLRISPQKFSGLEPKNWADVSADDIIQCVNAAASISDDSFSLATLTISKNKLSIVSVNQDGNTVESECPCNGDGIMFKFNTAYLQGWIVKARAEKIYIGSDSPVDAIGVSAGTDTLLLAPCNPN